MRIIRGLTSLVLLAVLVLGLPAVLGFFGGNPFPDEIPAWSDITGALTRPDDGTLLLGILTIAGWIGWASFAVTVLVEIPAQLRGVRAPRLPAGLGVPQAGARTLVAAVLAMLALTGPAADTVQAGQVDVHPGDTLSQIADTELGDPTRYPEIAAANPDLIDDPDLIRTGWTLQIPTPATEDTDPAAATTVTVDVRAGDTLWDLAETHLGDGARYPEIAAANPDLIDDPDLIQPGWALTVPTDATQAETPTRPKADPATHVDLAPSLQALSEAIATNTTPTPPAEANAPTTQRDATPAASNQDQAAEPAAPSFTADDDSQVNWNSMGVSALGAAGVLVLLAAARKAQSRRRQPGKRLAMPTGAGATAQTALRTDSDALAASDLDMALRALAGWAYNTNTPFPAVRAARITHDELEVYLVDDTAVLPEPFTNPGDPGAWVLHREHLPEVADATDLTDTPAPCPALVTLGLDDQQGWLLVNLEEIGSLNLKGNPEDTHAALAALALELIGSSWADDLRVTLVGTMPDLAGALASDRVEYVPTLDRVLAGVLHASDVHARTLTGSGHASVATARGAMVATETWTPHLLLLGGDPDAQQREDLREVLARVPRLAVATVTTDEDPLTEWVLHVREDRTGQLDPAQVQLTPQLLRAADYDGLIEAFITTQADDVDGPQWAQTLAGEPTLEDLRDLTATEDVDESHQVDQESATESVGDDSEEDSGEGWAAPVDMTLIAAPPPDLDAGVNDSVELQSESVPDSADLQEDPEPNDDLEPLEAPEENQPRVEEDQDDTADAAVTSSDPAAVPAVDTPDQADDHVDEPEPTTTESEPEGAGDGAGTVRDLTTATPRLRMFGAPEVRGATGKRPQAYGKATELIMFLALHPGDSHEPVDAALWPGKRMDASKRNSPVSQARSWLGHMPDGRPHVGHVNDIGYRLEQVSSDWSEFTTLIGDDISQASTTALSDALRLVEDQPFPKINARYYAWAEVDQHEMIAAIADVAHELSTRALGSGDARTAGWAAAKGLMVEEASELLWRDQLRAAWLSGAPGKTTEIAERMTDVLDTIGGDMDPETIELLEQLLTDRQPRRSHA